MRKWLIFIGVLASFCSFNAVAAIGLGPTSWSIEDDGGHIYLERYLGLGAKLIAIIAKSSKNAPWQEVYYLDIYNYPCDGPVSGTELYFSIHSKDKNRHAFGGAVFCADTKDHISIAIDYSHSNKLSKMLRSGEMLHIYFRPSDPQPAITFMGLNYANALKVIASLHPRLSDKEKAPFML
ncbi:TPA: hypothetical protein ACF3XD_004566 [Vibrio parahaemolyticus]|nr:hypothetical protein [Vibrio parahaemolyticus]HCH6205145.1 hypothetical protein [Vibrio parahaemolyticus]